jgi:hypothetical protein
MSTDFDSELEAFKSEIDLQGFAATLGYEKDKRESSRRSAIMRNGADKIIVKLDGDGHYLYFSVRDDRDNGTIIDFLQRRQHMNLGEVRKTLRPWLHGAAVQIPVFQQLERSSRDRGLVEAEYARSVDAPRHPYLEKERRLSPALLGSPRFAGRIRIDERGNAVFPHFDMQGLCGFEKKNAGYTGFAKGGEKGLWISQKKGDRRLVIAESAIDALSHAALFPDGFARYASIGGEMNPRQPALIKAAIGRMQSGSEIVAAFDADDQGLAFADTLGDLVETFLKETGRDDLSFKVHCPEVRGFDWNDVLQSPDPSFPTAPLPSVEGPA